MTLGTEGLKKLTEAVQVLVDDGLLSEASVINNILIDQSNRAWEDQVAKELRESSG